MRSMTTSISFSLVQNRPDGEAYQSAEYEGHQPHRPADAESHFGEKNGHRSDDRRCSKRMGEPPLCLFLPMVWTPKRSNKCHLQFTELHSSPRSANDTTRLPATTK